MADLYVRSTDGSDADNGTTWALAKATATGVAAIDSAGDTLWLSQAHAESTASAVTISLAGTLASPTRLLCGNDGAQPPTALATSASIATTGASGITINGVCYGYGFSVLAGSGAVNASIGFAKATGNEFQLYESCLFSIVATGTASLINIGPSAGANQSPAKVIWKSCDIKFGAVANGLQAFQATLVWDGGSVLAGSAAVTSLIISGNSNGRSGTFLISGVNLENLGTSTNLVAAGLQQLHVIFRDCKLPASWSGSLTSGTLLMGDRIEMHNCDSGDTNYRLWVEQYTGSIKSETTIIRTGGASDGTTGLAWKMATGANAEYPALVLYSPERAIWNDTTGSSKTLTVEIVHDSQGAGSGSKFQDDEIWLEVMYLGTSGFPLGTWIADVKTDVLAAAANQADSSVTWTTTGLTTPVKQALSVTFTPQEKGLFIYRIAMAKASKTCYVDPVVTVT